MQIPFTLAFMQNITNKKYVKALRKKINARKNVGKIRYARFARKSLKIFVDNQNK